MERHYAKECRANIEIVTGNTAQCRVCGQTYKRVKCYGKEGWSMKNDDSLLEYIRNHKEG